MHAPGSTNRLMPQHAARFAGEGLFDRLARTVCQVGVLPRKELYEAWEMARRVRRRVRGGRVVDLCCGHGLLAHLMLLLDDTSPLALAADLRLPPSHRPLAEALQAQWPRLQGRVRFEQVALEQVPLRPGDVVVSAHACGGLTDQILQQAQAVRAHVAVLPCCHHLAVRGDLGGWLDGPLALDVERAVRLRAAGYQIHTQEIPPEITPKNRLLLGLAPAEGSP